MRYKKLLLGLIVAGLIVDSSSSAFAQRPQFELDRLSGKQLFDFKWSHLDENARAELGGDKYQLVKRQQARRLGSRVGIRFVQGAIGDGLGPLHNATSCAECHKHGGAAGVEHNVTLITIDPRSVGLTTREGSAHEKNLLELFPGLVGEFGTVRLETVVHDKSASSSDEYQSLRNRLREHVPGGVDDNWFVPKKRTSEAIAKRPVVAGRFEEWDFYLSQRNAPPLFGLGLIDRIKPETLTRIAEKQSQDSGGEITGRVEGKFGWRGQVTSLPAFVGQACAGELGLTHVAAMQTGDPSASKYAPPGLDMANYDVEKLVQFVSSLPSPVESESDGRILRGEEIFDDIGCVACHVPDVWPAQGVFSDFLLHDMGYRLQAPSPAAASDVKKLAGTRVPRTFTSVSGPVNGGGSLPYYSGFSTGSGGLATTLTGAFGAGRTATRTPAVSGVPIAEEIEEPAQPQFPRGVRPQERSTGATWDDLQREWKTPALWGLVDTGPYLHDGRATTIEEAIEWHGGEAQQSADRFAALNKTDRDDLIRFLKSLKAPALPKTRQPSLPR